MRTYLVVVDQSPEAAVAVRFAARRASRTGGQVHLVGCIEPQDFVAFGAVAATMAAEARDAVEALVARVTRTIADEMGIVPRVSVTEGHAADVVHAMLADADAAYDIAALVLGAAATGEPGPLVAQFTGPDAGRLPCPVMIIPGSLDSHAIDRLS